MYTKSILLAALIAYAEARFGQEQIPIPAINALTEGSPGVAQTLAGGAVSTILAATDPCEKLKTADNIVSQLGNDSAVLAAAIGLVAAEKNTNPFVNNNTQLVCNDPTLPATPQLRGITPLIDPAAPGADAVNQLSAQTKTTPLTNTDGKSVFDLVNENAPGVVQGSGAASGASSATAAASAAASTAAAAQAATSAASNNAAASACPAPAASSSAAAVAVASAASSAAAAVASGTSSAQDATTSVLGQAAGNVTVGDANFGPCTPTIIFEAGQSGRPSTEFTFQIADSFVRAGQQDALNPNIITNALCNQLTNVCKANQAALDVCASAKAQVAALTARDKATADTFNTAMGFPNFITNPDGGPADVAASATAAAARRMRRGLRNMGAAPQPSY